MRKQISEDLPSRKHPQANISGGEKGGDAPAPKGGGDAPKAKEGGGDKAKGGTEESSEKRIKQAVYDIRYRARREDIDLRQAFSQYMSNSNLSQQERTAVRAKLFGKEGGAVSERYSDAGQLVSDSVAKAFNKVFVEGIDKEMELSYLEELKADPVKKYQVRVTDAKTERTYVRLADRSKITQLRQNPNIKSVEMTDHGDPYEGTKRAKKDFDKDKKVESPEKEHAGVVHNAIQKAKGGKPDGKDTRKDVQSSYSYGEAFIADAVGPHSDGHVALMEPEEEITDKPIDVMKGKNTKIIKINPKISEAKDEKKDDEAKDPLDTVGCNDPDPRSMKTKVQLMKNKLRARGLNMSHELEGEALVEDFIIESISMASDYFLSEGINEDGLEKIVEEVGLDDFTQFVLDLPQSDFLTEERSATRAKKRDYEKVKAAVYAKDEKNKKEGKREYSTTKLAKQKYGDEEAPEGKPEVKKTPVAKVVTATKTAKKTQNKSTSSPKGIIGKVGSFISKGIERHNQARQAGKVPEKRVKEFASGVKSGVQTAVNVAKVAYKATQPASKTTQKAVTRAQKAADRDKDGKVRTVDAGYHPQGEDLKESEQLAQKAYKRAQELGAKRRRSSDPSGIYKSERAGYNLAQSQRSRNTDTATQGGNQTGGGPKDFGFARHKRNPVKSKSIGDTGAQGHRKKANEKITHGKKGQKLKTARYRLSAQQRSDHHSDVWKREELRDPKKNPKHTANTNKPPKKEVSGKDTNVDLKKEEFLNQDLLSKMGRFMPKKSQTHRIDEEGYDLWRDKQLEKWGTGYRGTGPSGDRSGPSPRPTGKQPKGDTVYQKEMKKKYGGRLPSAVEVVRDKMKAKYGSNAVVSSSRSSSDRQAHQEKNYPNSSVVKGSIKGGKGVK